MDDLTIRIKGRWLRIAVIVAVTAVVAFPLGALASHRFTDVPDSHIFHNDISAIADAGVTLGCTADGTQYCPDDLVTRGQMAAFMNRLGALSADKTPVVNADKLDGKHAADLLGRTEKAADSDLLDGLDGLDYVLALDATALTSFPELISLAGGTRSECTAAAELSLPLNSYTVHYQLYATPDAAVLPPELVNVQTRIEATGADTSSLQVCLATLDHDATLLVGDYEANGIFTIFLEGDEAASLSLQDVPASELRELFERP